MEPEITPQAPKGPHYTWAADARFTLSGGELEFLIGTLSAFLNSEQARAVLAMTQVRSLLEKTLLKGLEDGTVTDVNALPQEEGVL